MATLAWRVQAWCLGWAACMHAHSDVLCACVVFGLDSRIIAYRTLTFYFARAGVVFGLDSRLGPHDVVLVPRGRGGFVYG